MLIHVDTRWYKLIHVTSNIILLVVQWHLPTGTFVPTSKNNLARYNPSALWPLLPPVDCLRPFRSTACVDRVMGNPAYDWRHPNRAGGGYNPTIYHGDLCGKNPRLNRGLCRRLRLWTPWSSCCGESLFMLYFVYYSLSSKRWHSHLISVQVWILGGDVSLWLTSSSLLKFFLCTG